MQSVGRSYERVVELDATPLVSCELQGLSDGIVPRVLITLPRALHQFNFHTSHNNGFHLLNPLDRSVLQGKPTAYRAVARSITRAKLRPCGYELQAKRTFSWSDIHSRNQPSLSCTGIITNSAAVEVFQRFCYVERNTCSLSLVKSV